MQYAILFTTGKLLICFMTTGNIKSDVQKPGLKNQQLENNE